MSYKIVVDSPCDRTPEMEKWTNLAIAPLTLQVDDFKTLDDENFDQEDFLRRMKAFDGPARSACPSLESWLECYSGDENDIYVITITGELSGTYNSAVQAKKIYLEESGVKKNIHIFDSLGTSSIETVIALKIHEVAETGASFEKVVETVEKYAKECELYFTLNSLDNLAKNGRLSNLQASLLTMLNVKLICKATNGKVDKLTQDISMNRAVIKMADIVVKQMEGKKPKECTLVVTECRAPERAQKVVDRILSKCKFGKVEILPMGGLNTLYSNEGSIIVGFSKIK